MALISSAASGFPHPGCQLHFPLHIDPEPDRSAHSNAKPGTLANPGCSRPSLKPDGELPWADRLEVLQTFGEGTARYREPGGAAPPPLVWTECLHPVTVGSRRASKPGPFVKTQQPCSLKPCIFVNESPRTVELVGMVPYVQV